ncbi:uncharacterized protein F4807DRAFT_464514 [Annulohypoxylon truncatum]|uniref:uncharacterized protein n=1 Tax=Annulohypoxylon truncatum TaxID=327061 RepID=UPI002007B97B|nr:uncharacterized protein F4807DRAFT_464514 [Annulohypoxylon truncatum]KAI1205633.1 hypothetical protein F4807DRAFT_464514 [Annulohypoxylon truncatum]
MFFSKTIALFLVAAAPLAFGLPAEESAQDDYWAQFCDDDACTQGCGESVRVSNPGCLNESGRKSILFHGSAGGDYALVVSPSGNCPCQNTCSSVPTGSTCWPISEYSGDNSFRFISGKCGSNNC